MAGLLDGRSAGLLAGSAGLDPFNIGATEMSADPMGTRGGRMLSALAQGLRDWIETPGRAMRDGMTTEQAVGWAAPTAMGMVGAPGAPAGAVGSGMARMGAGGKWNPLNEAELFKVLKRERLERHGGGTHKVYTSEFARDADRPFRTEWNRSVAEARAGIKGDALLAADNFAREVRPHAGPTRLEQLWPDDPISPRPMSSYDFSAPRGMTPKEQMSIADLLATFGLAGVPAAGVFGASMGGKNEM
jgi:hypothetical protein